MEKRKGRHICSYLELLFVFKMRAERTTIVQPRGVYDDGGEPRFDIPYSVLEV